MCFSHVLSDGLTGSHSRSLPSGTQAPGKKAWPTVNLNLLLLDKKNRAVISNITPPFQVLEDGVPKTVHIVSGPNTPVSLCIEIRVSGGVQRYWNEVREAAASLVKNLPPQSEVMIVFSADKTYLALPFTPASAALQKFPNLGYLPPNGKNSLFDSIAITEPYFVQFAHYQRRALVLMTDRIPPLSFDNTIRSMLIPGAPFVYALRVRKYLAPAFSPEDQLSMNRFIAFVKPSGGLSLALSPGQTDILEKTAEISRDIASQYAMNYESSLKIADKKFHKLAIKLPQEASQIRIQSVPGFYILTP